MGALLDTAYSGFAAIWAGTMSPLVKYWCCLAPSDAAAFLAASIAFAASGGAPINLLELVILTYPGFPLSFSRRFNYMMATCGLAIIIVGSVFYVSIQDATCFSQIAFALLAHPLCDSGDPCPQQEVFPLP